MVSKPIQAIIELKKMIQNRKEMIKTFRDKNQSWNQDKLPASVAKGLADFLTNEVNYLENVIKLLKPKSKCRHAKKYHDIDPDGNQYCTNCGTELALQ